ncbi:MAG: N-acetylmuramoyl-L-alanine amidase, partial [Bacteroidota bacterium]
MKGLLILCLIAGFWAESAVAQSADLSGLKFCIDPGHGGHNSNDRHIIPDQGIEFWESESNFRKALLLKALLEAHGAWVILTRTSNDTTGYDYSDPDEPSLSARSTLANANNVDWFHSIHSNASGLAINTSANYTLVLVKEIIATRQPAFPQAVTMSNLIGPAIQRKNRDTPRGTYTYLDYTFYGGPNDYNGDGKPDGFNLGVLSGLAMPGELSEGSFHDYFPETRRLMNNSYRKMEAYGLLDAFLTYFGAPADTGGIIAGIQTSISGGGPINATKVRLLPSNVVYTGDSYNNGFYMFDDLKAGTYRIRFETPGYAMDSVDVTLARGATFFADRALTSTFVADTIAPTIVNAFPGASGAVISPNQHANFTFSEPLNVVTTLSGSGNFAILENGVTEISVLTKYWKNGDRSGVDIWPIEGLKPGKQYTARVQSVKDPSGNTLSSALSVNFSTLANSFQITGIDDFNTPITDWLAPDSNAATEGTVSDSTRFVFSASPVIPALISLPSGNTGSAMLKYGWNTTDTSWLIHVGLKPGTLTQQWTKEGAHLQVYLHGDGSGTLFRFVVDDSVDAFPNGTPTNHEVSRWTKVDWIGWR